MQTLFSFLLIYIMNKFSPFDSLQHPAPNSVETANSYGRFRKLHDETTLRCGSVTIMNLLRIKRFAEVSRNSYEVPLLRGMA